MRYQYYCQYPIDSTMIFLHRSRAAGSDRRRYSWPPVFQLVKSLQKILISLGFIPLSQGGSKCSFPSVCSLTSRILSLSDGRTPPSPSGPISKGGLYIFVQGDLYESPSRLQSQRRYLLPLLSAATYKMLYLFSTSSAIYNLSTYVTTLNFSISFCKATYSFSIQLMFDQKVSH